MKSLIVLLSIITQLTFASEMIAYRQIDHTSLELNLVNDSGKIIYKDRNADGMRSYKILNDKLVTIDRFSNMKIINTLGKVIFSRQNVKSYDIAKNSIALELNSSRNELYLLKDNSYQLIFSDNQGSGIKTSDRYFISRNNFRDELSVVGINGYKAPESLYLFNNRKAAVSNNFMYFKDTFGYYSLVNTQGDFLYNQRSDITNIMISDNFAVVQFDTNDTEIYKADSDQVIYTGYDFTQIHVSNTFVSYIWNGELTIVNNNGQSFIVHENNIQSVQAYDQLILVTDLQNRIFAYNSLGEEVHFFTRPQRPAIVSSEAIGYFTSQADYTIYHLETDQVYSFRVPVRFDMFQSSNELLAVRSITQKRLEVFSIKNQKIVSEKFVKDFTLPQYESSYKWRSF